MRVSHFLNLLNAVATLFDDDGASDGSSQRAHTLRAFASAIAPLRDRSLDDLFDALAKVRLDENRE
jgi:hypothetical protein